MTQTLTSDGKQSHFLTVANQPSSSSSRPEEDDDEVGVEAEAGVAHRGRHPSGSFQLKPRRLSFCNR